MISVDFDLSMENKHNDTDNNICQKLEDMPKKKYIRKKLSWHSIKLKLRPWQTIIRKQKLYLRLKNQKALAKKSIILMLNQACNNKITVRSIGKIYKT